MAKAPEPLDEERQHLANMEAPYLRAKEYIKSDQYETDLIAVVAKVRKIIQPGREWTGDKAMFAIGGISQVLDEFSAKTEIIAKYESLQESVRRQAGMVT